MAKKILSSDQRVIDWYNNYHAKKISNPSIYCVNSERSAPNILICVPQELTEYAESNAGHHGLPEAIPVGMRRSASNPEAYVAAVFASTESVARFLNSSAADAPEYCATVRSRAKYTKEQLTILDLLDSDVRIAFDKVYGQATANTVFAKLYAKFGKASVLSDYRVLTLNEFEMRYGLNLAWNKLKAAIA
jgi:hypothetical protein